MEINSQQLKLPFSTFRSDLPGKTSCTRSQNVLANKLDPQDAPIHNWYRFVLSFPPHLVRDYVDEFALSREHTLLDPFCGTGTTLVESKLCGVGSIGLEANPFAHFASSVKVDWSVDPDIFSRAAHNIATTALSRLEEQGIHDSQMITKDIEIDSLKKLDPDAAKLVLSNSISPLPLHKTLVLLDGLNQYHDQPYHKHALLALAKALVFSISNLKFGPEVGLGKLKPDSPVVALWLSEVRRICNDLRLMADRAHVDCNVFLGDSRHISDILKPNSIDAVITSPPYPNEKDYTRTTRLESVILGFIRNKQELRNFKKNLIRSNTRGVYKGDEDDSWIQEHREILEIANQIEQRRIELGKTSGFERSYHKVTRLYFGGMARHLSDIRSVLNPGAHLAYVVGEQASYLRVLIPTGRLLADIAKNLGYELVRIDLFRTRFATATRMELREEVVILRWPGK
jgi:hypothetical protein